MIFIDSPIKDTRLVKLDVHADTRGSFFESFRASWFGPERRWIQWNVSRSVPGAIRGLHFHRRQTDYWILVEGTIQVALVDLRRKSTTYRHATCLELDSADPHGLIIPPGVLHGFRAHRDVTLMYLLDQEYDGGDEFAVRWDDPALGLPAQWYDARPPILSPRDIKAPLLQQANISDL